MLGLGNKNKTSEVRRRAVVDEEPSYKRVHTISGYDSSVALEKNKQE